MLKNLVRDWAREGAAEREQSYGKILVKLFDHFQAGTSASALVESLYSVPDNASLISLMPQILSQMLVQWV